VFYLLMRRSMVNEAATDVAALVPVGDADLRRYSCWICSCC